MCAYFAAVKVDGDALLVLEPATKGERLLDDIFDGFMWSEPGAIVWRLAEAFSFSTVTVVFNFLVADVPVKPVEDLRRFGGGTFLSSDEDPLSPGEAAMEDSRRMGFAVFGHISFFISSILATTSAAHFLNTSILFRNNWLFTLSPCCSVALCNAPFSVCSRMDASGLSVKDTWMVGLDREMNFLSAGRSSTVLYVTICISSWLLDASRSTVLTSFESDGGRISSRDVNLLKLSESLIICFC